MFPKNSIVSLFLIPRRYRSGQRLRVRGKLSYFIYPKPFRSHRKRIAVLYKVIHQRRRALGNLNQKFRRAEIADKVFQRAVNVYRRRGMPSDDIDRLCEVFVSHGLL